MKGILILINCLKFVGQDLMTPQLILRSGFGVFPPQFSFTKTNHYLKPAKPVVN